MGRRICLVGFSELSRDWANEQPDDVEIWGMNESHHFLKRCDRQFQIHPRNWNASLIHKKGWTYSVSCEDCGWEKTGKPDEPSADVCRTLGKKHAHQFPGHTVIAGRVRLDEASYGRTPHHLRWLSTCGIPVYMQNQDERIPTSIRFPFEAVAESLGHPDVTGKKRLYLTSSAAWMLAFALWEHKEGLTISEIRTPGIEMLLGTEYARQKPCVEFWLGRAMGMGIEWIRPPTGSSLVSDAIYAVDYLEPQRIEEELVRPVTVFPDGD